MHRGIVGLAFAAMCLSVGMGMVPNAAGAFEGFRGSSWGELRLDLPSDGPDNLLTNAWIRQGADWKRWGGTTLNTYATLRLRSDTERLPWNNSVGPGLGIALDAYSEKGIVGTWGVEYLWDNYYEDDNRGTEGKAVIYMNWYSWWDLARRD